MQALKWLLRAVIFFTLFAFALNNEHEVALKWFFGYESRAPMVFIVLAVFALGAVFGALAMLPSWWRHRRAARHPAEATASRLPAAPAALAAAETVDTEPSIVPPYPPRDGL